MRGDSDITKILRDSTPEGRLQLKTLLVKGSQDRGMVLLKAIEMGKTSLDLLPIAMCLRYGASPNMYINSRGLSAHIHLLAFVHKVLTTTQVGEDYPDTLIALLIMAGADLTKPVYDEKMGGIRSEEELLTPSSTIYDGPTVREWLRNEGYPLVEQYHLRGGINNVIDVPVRRMLSILLDSREYMALYSQDMGSPQINSMIFKSLGDNVIAGLNLESYQILWTKGNIASAFKNLNVKGFNYVVKSGQLPTYPDINDMLVLAQRYMEKSKKEEPDMKTVKNTQIANKHAIAVGAIVDMIRISVNNGVVLDSHQRDILGGLDQKFFDEVNKAYEQPYWKKACFNPKQKEVPERLRKLALELNIPTSSHEEVCTQLKRIHQSDKKEVKESAMRRKQVKLGADHGYISEFVNGAVPSLACSNSAKINGRPSDYSDLNISSYRNSRGNVYCFTSDKYEDILSTKHNIVSGGREKFPDEFLDEVAFKLSVLKKAGFDLTRAPAHLTETLDTLWEVDKYEDTPVNIDRIVESLEDSGITRKKFLSLKADQIQAIADNLSIRSNFRLLTSRHAVMTLAWVLNWTKEKNPSLYKNIVSGVSLL